eukprot:scaffold19101_cov73-Isochrysis_galbana.AAC.2
MARAGKRDEKQNSQPRARKVPIGSRRLGGTLRAFGGSVQNARHKQEIMSLSKQAQLGSARRRGHEPGLAYGFIRAGARARAVLSCSLLLTLTGAAATGRHRAAQPERRAPCAPHPPESPPPPSRQPRLALVNTLPGPGRVALG